VDRGDFFTGKLVLLGTRVNGGADRARQVPSFPLQFGLEICQWANLAFVTWVALSAIADIFKNLGGLQ
jgi:hypothetical protein